MRGRSFARRVSWPALAVLLCSCAGFSSGGDPYDRGWDLFEAYRFAEAEAEFRRALALNERRWGPRHLRTAAALRSVAAALDEQGRYEEAEPVARRALAIAEANVKANDPVLVHYLTAAGMTAFRVGRYADAEPYDARALEILRRSGEGDSAVHAQVLNNLAAVHKGLGQLDEAAGLFEQALAMRERLVGPDSAELGGALHNLAWVYDAQGRHKEALRLLERAITLVGKANIPDDPFAAHYHATEGVVLAHLGRLPEAGGALRRAAKLQRARIYRDAALASTLTTKERTTLRVFPNVLRVGARAAEAVPSERARLVDDTIQAAQILQATDTGAAVARVAARFGAGDDALAAAVRGQQDLAERWRGTDRALLGAFAAGSAAREAELRRELRTLAAELDASRREIAARFSEYDALVSPEPVDVPTIQSLLEDDEALLLYSVLERDTYYDEDEATFVWLVRRERAEVRRLDLAPGELASAVRSLRGQLDPSRWASGMPPAFDTALAHRLYRKLLPEDPSSLAGVRHLLVVPHGPLESLPFGVLVRTPPNDGAAYREVDWLARTYATTTLPSVSSLRALRRFAKPSRAAEPFRGVGDPVLTGPVGPQRGVDVARLFTTRGLADPAQVRSLPPLPETAAELRELASAFAAGEGSLLLRERATEAAVKAGTLSNARVVAFATHAGVAGELPGLAEPALVLTPPTAATAEDDGLLTASEAATLSLDADLVLLSACNTAASDGTPGAAGLSGLAKAFIHAGGRSLLVSHWPVLSEAAQRLTTGMFAELAREPSVERAEALRRAMVALVDRGSASGFDHPAAWAPFVMVGEGGRPAPAALSGS